MLLSMTGHGQAQGQQDGVTVSVELRTINSRYFKFSIRSLDLTAALESRLETLIRKQVKRGTVQCNLRIAREAGEDDYHINLKVLEGYLQQLRSVSVSCGSGSDHVPLAAVLGLPGVVDESAAGRHDVDVFWPLLESVTQSALRELDQMRSAEGQAMARDLRVNCRGILDRLGEIQALAPDVVVGYQQRLTEKLQVLLADHQVAVSPADVVREVGIYADRVDISEETVRLQSHLDQFLQILEQEDSAGRKLEFLIQEMFRETNTIGSKANNAEIAQHVVEIKTTIERIREMVQNVE